jgi:predicted RNA-binding protein with PUA-like domain
MAVWLFKTEPSEYSFADLQRERRCVWTGVSNPQAVNFLREVAKGDEVLIYHTGDEKAVVGLARVLRGGFPDPDQPALDAKGRAKFIVCELAPVRPAAKPVPLATIKADARFKDFALLKLSRLSVMPVPPAIDRALRALGGLGGLV